MVFEIRGEQSEADQNTTFWVLTSYKEETRHCFQGISALQTVGVGARFSKIYAKVKLEGTMSVWLVSAFQYLFVVQDR